MADNTGVIYGKTNTYKTWNLGLLAKHIFSKTKKPVRYITADGGGYRPIQPFIDAGIIIPLQIVNDPSRLLIMKRIVEGYFPQDIENGLRISKTFLTPDSLKNIGGVIFEGITSIGESLQNLYAGKATGMKPAYSEPIHSDFTDTNNKLVKGDTIGGFSMDSYGLIQAEVMRLINFSWTLPVKYVWWSGHEVVVEDDSEGYKNTVVGIGLVGKAAAPRMGKQIGTLIHASRVELGNDKEGNKKSEVRYYYESHADLNLKNAFWDAKTRVPGDVIEDLRKNYPNGYFIPEPKGGLDCYVGTEEELMKSNTDEILKWKEEILKDVK